MKPFQIAIICHQANKAVCEANGDHTQKDWDDAEQWQRDSAIVGVNYALANPNGSASGQHDAWMADKIANGWVYGEVKDANLKTHPCIVPYDDLPVDQRTKDYVFRAIVEAALNALTHTS